MSASSQELETLSWVEALQRYSDAWAGLVSDGNLNPSLLPGWMNSVLVGHDATASTSVHCLKESGRLVAVLPIVAKRERIRGVSARVALAGSSIVSYHEELLPPSRGGDLLRMVLDQRMRGQWDVFRMVNVPFPSGTAEAFESWARMRGYQVATWEGERSPYLVIDKDWQGYLQSQGKRFRANVTRVLRRPMELGGGEIRWFERGADTKQLLADILRVEDASWKRDQGVAISSRDFELRYHQMLLPYLERGGMLLANVLYVSGVPAAYVLCAVHNGWVGQLKTSFDAKVKDAGACVITASVRRAFETGATEYDFLGDADAHKLKWTGSVRAHRSYMVFARTPVGLALSASQRLVVPAKRLREKYWQISRRGVDRNASGSTVRAEAVTDLPAPNQTVQGWRLTPIEAAREGWWADWDRLCVAGCGRHPNLEARFAQTLIRHFGGGAFLAEYLEDSGPAIMAIVHRRSPWQWSFFQPSQAPLPMIVFRSGIENGADRLRSLIHALSATCSVLDVPSQDPEFSLLEVNGPARWLHLKPYGTTVAIRRVIDFTDYWQHRPAKLRQNIGRYFRRLESHGYKWNLEIVTDRDEMADAVGRYGLLESAGWKGQSGSAIHPDNPQGKFYRDLLERFAETGDAQAYLLRLNGQLAAARLAIRSAAMAVMLKTTFDEKLSSFAPGRLVTYLALRELLGPNGAPRVEFYTKANHDTLAWGTEQRELFTATLFRSEGIAALAAARRRLLERVT